MEWDESTRALINDVAEQAADKTVARTLQGMGVDIDDPLAMQRDMQFVRAMRETWHSAKARSLFVALGLMVTGFFAFLWGAIRAQFGGMP